MKKIILFGITLCLCFGLVACGSSSSFEFSVKDVKTTNSEGTFAIGKVEKGTLNDGDVVTIKRDGKTIKSVKVKGLVNTSKDKDAKSITKGDEAYVGLGDIGQDDISINDVLVKE
ncbi:reductase [Inconstantimicrobium mannanitabidum]|uniref:Reductase n=1 Tax=Inconstantimicrobium mannanitabidum TaxID=1604901 RepID=A0ACB5REW7_9CLOT|nr:reductase [Clostridium sp. TW13]GKX67276.1 reductase [Clostridium sp. TW13]